MVEMRNSMNIATTSPPRACAYVPQLLAAGRPIAMAREPKRHHIDDGRRGAVINPGPDHLILSLIAGPMAVAPTRAIRARSPHGDSSGLSRESRGRACRRNRGAACVPRPDPALCAGVAWPLLGERAAPPALAVNVALTRTLRPTSRPELAIHTSVILRFSPK
jgi:hypothetical protein